MPEAVATVARPLGIAELDIAGRDAAFVKVTVEPGMSAWEVIQQAAEASGLWPWFTPDGTLKIAAPDYTTPPVAALIMRLDGKGNNVIDIEIDKGCERRYSEVTVLAQGAGTEKKKSKNAMKGKATDPNVKWHRPLIVSEGCLDSPGDALKKAKKRLADGVMDSFTITAKVRGHRTSDGKLWEPGQRVTLNGDKHVYFLTRRTFNGGRDGTTTTLVLKPDGVWLPDTSKKGKRGKKGKKPFSGSWDYGDKL